MRIRRLPFSPRALLRRSCLVNIILALGLAACGPVPGGDVATRTGETPQIVMPPVKSFATPHPIPPQRSNRDIGRDFLDLAFQLESGRELPRLTRFEGPISLRVTGQGPATLDGDLDRLLKRLRNEAMIDIRRTDAETANITISIVTRQQIRRHLPSAACFVVPNISDLSGYRAARNRDETDWTKLQDRQRIAVFVPSDSSPQELRDCLHEEMAQALGPLNDLYRLPDSVFNDDNVHAVLTGFDMLILRAYYAPELRSGMTRAEVASRLPGILARMNPEGEHRSPTPVKPDPRDWIDAIQSALGPEGSATRRRADGLKALGIAQSIGLDDHRLAFTHFALGRVSQTTDPEFAYEQFLQADRIYARLPGMELHRSYVAAQLAAFAISQGQSGEALRLLGPQLAIAERHENAALLASLMLLNAEALEQAGRDRDAQALRLDSLGWARYGYGADWIVRAKLREISALNQSRKTNG